MISELRQPNKKEKKTMKKQIITIILAAATILIGITSAAAEVSTEEFIRQLMDALQKKDARKIGQLVMQNPEAAKQAHRMLQKAGQGKDENAKIAKAVGDVLSQILQMLQKAGADDPETVEMKRLNEEAKKLWLGAKYPQAVAKLEEGLELAKKAGDKKKIGIFLGNIGTMYDDLGQYDKALT
jgi:tetratricopeptide (TPR) repeat protein